MIRTCDHSVKSFLSKLEKRNFFHYNEIEWTSGASSGLSYFDQIVLRRGNATPPPCVHAMRNTVRLCRMSPLASITSFAFPLDRKRRRQRKGLYTKNRNKKKKRIGTEKKMKTRYTNPVQSLQTIATMGSNPFGFDIN
jgi:hypothetical protein